MKNLVIKSNNFELGRVALDHPQIFVGRSPKCDLVLRAPGIKPQHYVLEWKGENGFNSDKGDWFLIDSTNSSITLLTSKGATRSGFKFLIEGSSHSQLLPPRKSLRKDLKLGKKPTYEKLREAILEIVWTKVASGQIEDIVHLSQKNLKTCLNKKLPVIKGLPQLKIEKESDESGETFGIMLYKMPHVSVLCEGKSVETQKISMKVNEKWTVESNGDRLDFRLVDVLEKPLTSLGAVGTDFINTGLLSSVAFGLLVLSTYLSDRNSFKENLAEEVEPHIVQLQIRKEISTQEEAAPSVSVPVANTVKERQEVLPQKQRSDLPSLSLKVIAPKAASPRLNAEAGISKAGLNAPAKKATFNQMGILGLLSKNNSNAGKGVKAELLIKQGIQSNSLSANEGEAKLLIKNLPSGTIGRGLSGNPRTHSEDMGVLVASTSMRGIGKASPTSLGAVAKASANGNWGVGTSLKGDNTGPGSGSQLGFGDEGSVKVEGGLDRETVRRIISGYRGKIRICYDKALVTNPHIAGRISNKWTISSQGPVADARIVKSAVSSTLLEGCILGVVKSMLFPKAPNGRATTVIYPFEFMAK